MRIGNYINKYQILNIKYQNYQNEKLKIKNIQNLLSYKDKQILNEIKLGIKKVMWEKVGIVRKKTELLEALKTFKEYKKQLEEIKEKNGISRALIEVLNLSEVAIQITQAALKRSKSLGAHYIMNCFG
jgi:aspartate oxidase